MTGTISTYLEEKQYGYIKGDDNRDYWFHQSSVDKKDKIIDGTLVDFEPQAKPNGYAASEIKIKIDNREVKYLLPDDVFISKDKTVKGWETIDKAQWVIIGSSRHSPDEARNLMKQRAKMLRVNALTGVKYSKTTGKEAGTGYGTHHYTIHNFMGIPTNIGKKSLVGTVKEEDLTGLDSRLIRAKTKLQELTKKNSDQLRLRMIIFFIIIGIATSLTLKENIMLPLIFEAIVVLFIGLNFIGYENKDDWLKKLA